MFRASFAPDGNFNSAQFKPKNAIRKIVFVKHVSMRNFKMGSTTTAFPKLWFVDLRLAHQRPTLFQSLSGYATEFVYT